MPLTVFQTGMYRIVAGGLSNTSLRPSMWQGLLVKATQYQPAVLSASRYILSDRGAGTYPLVLLGTAREIRIWMRANADMRVENQTLPLQTQEERDAVFAHPKKFDIFGRQINAPSPRADVRKFVTVRCIRPKLGGAKYKGLFPMQDAAQKWANFVGDGWLNPSTADGLRGRARGDFSAEGQLWAGVKSSPYEQGVASHWHRQGQAVMALNAINTDFQFAKDKAQRGLARLTNRKTFGDPGSGTFDLNWVERNKQTVQIRNPATGRLENVSDGHAIFGLVFAPSSEPTLDVRGATVAVEQFDQTAIRISDLMQKLETFGVLPPH